MEGPQNIPAGYPVHPLSPARSPLTRNLVCKTTVCRIFVWLPSSGVVVCKTNHLQSLLTIPVNNYNSSLYSYNV